MKLNLSSAAAALGTLCLGFAFSAPSASAQGMVIVTGDDADDSGHCTGSRCGNLFRNLFNEALVRSNQGTGNILAVGANNNRARTGFDSWNSAVGAPVLHCNSATCITSEPIGDHSLLYIASGSNHTRGGLTSGQQTNLNTRAADIKSYNDDGGAIIALTEANRSNGWGWLPVTLTTANRSFTNAIVDPNLAAISPTTTNANLSHCCFHNVFTGPPGFSGLDVLATQNGQGNQPVMLGGLGTILTAEVCDDGLDNDGDGDVDQADSDCWVCGDGILDVLPNNPNPEECDDGNTVNGDGCADDCTLENQPPNAVCVDVTVSADINCEGCASVDGGTNDPDGDILTIVENPTCNYGLGDTVVTLTADDGLATASCTGTVTVEDDSGPDIVGGDGGELWPPNHKYASFDLSDCASVADNCDAGIDIDADGTITSITSDEPENAQGNGDGNTTDDMVITGNSSFKLRKERAGGEDGRVYTVNFDVSDADGNVSSSSCTFTVPHNQGPNGAAVDSGAAYSIP